MAKATFNVDASDFSKIITDALTGLKGVANEAIQTLAAEFAPKFAALVSSEDPQGDYDDIMLNMEIAYGTLGVEAETLAGQVVQRALQAALATALKLVASVAIV